MDNIKEVVSKKKLYRNRLHPGAIRSLYRLLFIINKNKGEEQKQLLNGLLLTFL